MKATLFLFYLRAKKPLLIMAIAVAIIPTALNLWFQYRPKDRGPWQVIDVANGSSLTVSRKDVTKIVSLCGVAGGDENYLRTIVGRGDGTVQLEKTGAGYEAWILLEPDYERQVHINTHLVERGVASVSSNASQCLSREQLAMAETIARSDKLGIWNR